MNFLSGWDRHQVHLLPASIEEYVGPDNPVRFLDAFVDSLDLAPAGFVFPKDDPLGRGRPAFAPADLLKLYLYGYLRQIRSSRRLEAECRRNLEVVWLLRQLTPNFKTIADFRKNNAPAFRAVVREFTVLCQQLDLFGGELFAIDGTKIKASNAPGKNFSRTKLEKRLARVEQRMTDYLRALDEADEAEAIGPLPAAWPNAEQLQQKIAKLKEKKQRVEQRLGQLDASGESQVSLTDPDSRAMGTGARSLVGYNVQGAVDSQHHLLVSTEVIQASNDLGQLAPQAQAAKAELGVEHVKAVADTGYYKSEDIKTCQENGIEPHVRAGQMSPSERAGRYGKADFAYDPGRDLYRCPAGAELKRRRRMEVGGKGVLNYDNPKACATCSLRTRCAASGHRTVSRWEHEASLEQMAAAVAAHPETLAARGSLIEHCWGTMKWLLPGGFLVRGLERVGAEVSLAHWAYNFKRAWAVVGLEGMLAVVRERRGPRGWGVSGKKRPCRHRTGLSERLCARTDAPRVEWSWAA